MQRKQAELENKKVDRETKNENKEESKNKVSTLIGLTQKLGMRCSYQWVICMSQAS